MPLQRTPRRTESAELAAAGEASLRRSFERVSTLTSGIESIDVQPGSLLAESNRWTTVQPLSDQLVHLEVSSHDHLSMVSRYVDATGSVPAMASYTLVRTSIEAASLGIWLITAGSLDERILRSLQLSWRNAWDANEFAKVAGIAETEGLAELQLGLIQDRDRRQTIAGRRIDTFPSWTRMVTGAEKHALKAKSCTGIQAWKACSAIAHSNRELTQGLLEHQTVGEGPRSAYRMSTRLSTLAKLYEVGVNYLETLITLVSAGSRPTFDPTRRPTT